MRSVRQNDKKWPFGGVRIGLAVIALATIAAGCGQGQGQGQGREEGQGQAGSGGAPAGPAAGPPRKAPPARALDDRATKLRAEQAARAAAAKRWGLKRVPLTAPPPPAKKPEITTRDGFEVDGHRRLGLPPVFTTVPTEEKILFLTIDDGDEKDPAFLRMMSELKIPYSAFLSDYLAKEDYGYFEKMRDRGVSLHNHTLHHPYLPGLSRAGQKREICGMQDVVEKRYGERPVLFRPPYGNYNKDTLRVAKSCGITHVPLWNEEVFVDHWEYREWDRDLHPGDIVLTHFRGRDDWKGTMPDMVRRFLDKATAEGYAVARLEDYL